MNDMEGHENNVCGGGELTVKCDGMATGFVFLPK
jgi:hypothetical protein